MGQIQFIIDNWTMIVAFICVIVLAVQRIVEFISLPTEKKMAEIRARLLGWVREAEADLGAGTGSFKLSQVYDLFCRQYPDLKKWFSLEKFDLLVKEALAEMEELLKDDNARVNALQRNK